MKSSYIQRTSSFFSPLPTFTGNYFATACPNYCSAHIGGMGDVEQPPRPSSLREPFFFLPPPSERIWFCNFSAATLKTWLLFSSSHLKIWLFIIINSQSKIMFIFTGLKLKLIYFTGTYCKTQKKNWSKTLCPNTPS